jgi:hypothetical protein
MCNVEFHDLYCLLDCRVSERSGIMGKECGRHRSEGSHEQIFYWKIGRKGSI